jgi:hypothetical protein
MMSGWLRDNGVAQKAIDKATTVGGVADALPWEKLGGEDSRAAFISYSSSKGGAEDLEGMKVIATKAINNETVIRFYTLDALEFTAAVPMGLDKTIKETSIDSAWDLESQYRHQPSEVFSKLSNQRMEMNFSNQSGPPVSGEDPFLRTLSPFTIQLLPPADMTDQPAATTTVTTSYAIAQAAANSAGFTAADLGADGLGNAQAAASGMVATGAMNTKRTGLLTTHDLASIYSQVAAMAMTPPLVFLINPSSMNIQYQKLQQFQTRTRNGYVFQSWGEQQPTISFSGRIGAFYAAESLSESRAWANHGYTPWGTFQGDYGKTSTATGVQEASRRDSASYQNLMNLFQVYRNNAYIRDGVSGSGAHHMIGMVCIEYDQWAYYGHFGKFDFSFTQETNLGGVNYSFDFVCSRIEDRASSAYHVRPLESPLGTQSGGGFLSSGGNTDPVAAALAGNQGDMEEPRWMKEGFTWPAYETTNRTELVIGYGSESWDSKMGGKGWEGTGLSGPSESEETGRSGAAGIIPSYSDDAAGVSAKSVDTVLALAATLKIEDAEALAEIAALLEILTIQQQIISDLPYLPETPQDFAAAESATKAAIAALNQMIAIVHTLSPDLSLLERSQMVSKLVKARTDLRMYWEAVNPGATSAVTVDPVGLG